MAKTQSVRYLIEESDLLEACGLRCRDDPLWNTKSSLERIFMILEGHFEKFSNRDLNLEDESTLCNVLLSCETLCENDEKQKDTFAENGGVKILTQFINQVINALATEIPVNPLLQIAFTNCIYKCVADSPTCLEIFIAYEGMFKILDYLEISEAPPCQLHILNCILELCEYPRCFDQLIFWKRKFRHVRGRFASGDGLPLKRQPIAIRNADNQEGEKVSDEKDISLSAVFCEIWRREERRLGVLRDGLLIGSLEEPLMSQYARDYKRKNVNEKPGPPVLDMIGCVRSKIYLLLKRVIEVTPNGEMTTFRTLSMPNQITMQIIINYLDLKKSEIWIETVKSLKNEELRMVSSDEKALQLFYKISLQKIETVFSAQKALLRYEESSPEVVMSEKELYRAIRKCYHLNQLLMKREVDFFAWTSHYYPNLDGSFVSKLKRVKDSGKEIGGEDDEEEFGEDDDEEEFGGEDDDEECISSNSSYSIGSEGERIMPIAYEKLELDITGKSLSQTSASDTVEWKKLKQHAVTEASLINPTDSPFSDEDESVFEINPILLTKALQALLRTTNKWNWVNIKSDDAWMMRTKWKIDWYP